MTTQVIFDLFPIGTILPYAGDPLNIPTGWFVCDGTNKTVNLVRRPPIGLATGEALALIGTVVGNDTHTHSFTQGQQTPWDNVGGSGQGGNGFSGSPHPHFHSLAGVVTDETPNLPLSTLVFFIQKVQ